VTRSQARTPDRRGPNCLLAGLPATVYGELAPHFSRASLATGDVLYEPLARLTSVYFPDSAVLSLIARMADGTAVEVGTVGNEGFVGLSVLLGVAGSPAQCVVQVPGAARVLPARVLRSAIADGGPLRDVLLRYAHAFLHQVAQRAACSVLHTVPQRCARWLLVTDDTAGGGGARGARGGFMLTQEDLASMLGVRREGVSAAERRLRSSGLIRFSRGRITVTDRAGLEAASCECYAAVTAEYRRVLDGRPQSSGPLRARAL
jgi:CRP-like cAMP-binding protein